MKKKFAFGFTLIELLVVIAIIAMLASILIPAVTKALTNAAMTQTTSNGRAIYLSAFSDQLDNMVTAGAGSSAWPASTNYSSSSKYFQYLVDEEIMQVAPSFFSAKGLASADKIEDLGSANNAWRLVVDITDSIKDGVPFLYTLNFPFENSIPTGDALFKFNAVDPFGVAGGVVVQKGGAAMALKTASQRHENVFNAATTNATNVKVVGP